MRTRTHIPTAVAAGPLAALVLLSAAPPAAAHGDTIAFTVTALADGHLTALATWENDRDPVTDRVAGTLGATAADGRTVGPWPLVVLADPPGAYTTALQLPPGHWKVVVESGFPALGRGEAELDVTAVPGTAPRTPVPTPTPAVAAAEPDGGSPAAAVVVTAGAVLAALTAVALVLRRRRPAR